MGRCSSAHLLPLVPLPSAAPSLAEDARSTDPGTRERRATRLGVLVSGFVLWEELSHAGVMVALCIPMPSPRGGPSSRRIAGAPNTRTSLASRDPVCSRARRDDLAPLRRDDAGKVESVPAASVSRGRVEVQRW